MNRERVSGIDLKALPTDPSPPDMWQDQAACYGIDPDVFFPTSEEEAGPALAYCNACRSRRRVSGPSRTVSATACRAGSPSSSDRDRPLRRLTPAGHPRRGPSYCVAMSQAAVRSTAPLRISFVGGGTDFPHYFERHGGAVLSATIDRHAHVTLLPRPDREVRIRSDLGHLVEYHLDERPAYDGVMDAAKAAIERMGVGRGSTWTSL